MNSIKRIILVVLFLILTVALSTAQSIPQASDPEEVGLLKERLQRISVWIQADIDKKVIPGAVVMVLRKGKIAYFEAFGYQDQGKNIPMTRDSIFRIASMTKPFVALATMMLVEEGKIQLFDPVTKYLPEFKDLKVGVEKKNPETGKTELILENPGRQMTVQDLLRHTSGLTYGFTGKSMVRDLYNAANLFDRNQSVAEMVTKISKLPLQDHPGTTWDYSMSNDILGRIVEVASGVEFDTFLEERIVKPLKLTDTAFWADGAGRQARIAEPQIKTPWFIDVTKKPKLMLGGSGMVSTAHDYARFCLMLHNGGILDGVRLVSRKTVEQMVSNHIPPGYKYFTSIPLQILWRSPSLETGQGYGLGFGINCQPGLNPSPGSKGDYYWTGIYGTLFWVDPKEQVIAIMMTQGMGSQHPNHHRLRQSVYQAIID